MSVFDAVVMYDIHVINKKGEIMGTYTTYECPMCGKKVKLNEGLGMMWCRFDKSMFYKPKGGFGLNFYSELDKKTLEEVHKFIEEAGDVIVDEAYYQPYICKECGKIESKLFFKIYADGKTYSPKYSCKCGHRYKKLTEKEQEHLHCNKCGCKMVVKDEMYWD